MRRLLINVLEDLQSKDFSLRRYLLTLFFSFYHLEAVNIRESRTLRLENQWTIFEQRSLASKKDKDSTRRGISVVRIPRRNSLDGGVDSVVRGG